jgi:tetratricopeptide (TPR) repeat protein
VGLAEQGYRRAIAAFRELGEVEGVGRNLGNLGNLLRDQGKWDEAETALREGLALVREAGDRMTEGIILGNLAEQLRVQKRFKDARDVIAEAQVLQRRMGDDEGLAKSTSNLAEVYACEGNLDKAIELARAAVAQLEALENPLLEAGARRRLAEHLFENDRLDEAEVEAAAAAETLKRIGAQELLCGSVLPLEVRIAVKRGIDAAKKTALLDRLDEAEAVLRKLGLSNESGGILRIDNSRELLRGET